jgi:elongator complex protein 3 (tRNA carboxymethyluridine synthase)
MNQAVGESQSQNAAYEWVCKEIALELESLKNPQRKEILAVIKKACSNHKLPLLPANQSILAYVSHKSTLRKLLKVKPVKTASGVAVIALMPKPYACPHGRCIYCPGGVNANVPLSYTGTEPCAKYAQQYNFDPFMQIQSKMKQLYSRGHGLDKVELVIVGGTFPFFPAEYQRDFVKLCYDALNNTSARNLKESMMINEKAETRCVGFTVETKPDYCKSPHVDAMLELGMTRVEIGVQSLQEDTYRAVNRGHNLYDVIESFQIARDAGYKIVAHMMPGLPGSTPTRDMEDFHKMFDDPLFKPDMLKIYPTLVLKNTGLYSLYKSGKYNVYSDEDYIRILTELKKDIPPWVRIMRVQREIEAKDIVAGPREGNLRQLALSELQKLGLRCRCIRCREVGLQRRMMLQDNEICMTRLDYVASDGKEVFLSFESKDKQSLLGFLRLRNPAIPHRPEIRARDCSGCNKSAIIRELHVYGVSVDIGCIPGNDSYQHKGYGTKLMQEAERIVRDEFSLKKISVISAVGTREYYRKIGYVRNGPYMTKILR